MILIRRYLPHVLFGIAVGAAAFELWQYVLPETVPLWLTCAAAVAFVLAAEYAVADLRERRARRTRPHRRAHARSPRQARLHDPQTSTPTTSRKDTTPA